MPLFHLALEGIILLDLELIQRFRRLKRLLNNINTSFFRDSWLTALSGIHFLCPFHMICFSLFSLLAQQRFLILLPQVIQSNLSQLYILNILLICF